MGKLSQSVEGKRESNCDEDVAVCIEDFYPNRPIRFYDQSSPTLRSDRVGLKVAENLSLTLSDGFFVIDKGYKFQEREICNCITNREDRGMSIRRQEGTLVCIPMNEIRSEDERKH